MSREIFNWKKWRVVVGVFLAIDIIVCVDVHLQAQKSIVFAYVGSVWAVWSLMAIIIVALTKKIKLGARSLLTNFLLIGFCSIVITALSIALGGILVFYFREMLSGWPFPATVEDFLRQASDVSQDTEILRCWLIFGLCYAYDYYIVAVERERRTAELQAQLTTAKLLALKYQLNPHFLFNTLHTIAGMMRQDQKEAAITMISGLSDLLRATLARGEEQEVRLEKELDMLKLYLAIEQVRFSDRLQVTIAAPPDTLAALVPNLVLQPLVENALKHGLAPEVSGGTLAVTAERQNGQLWLEVCDDGVGLPAVWELKKENGVGLKNTLVRLEHLYGKTSSLEICNRNKNGVRVAVRIPWHSENLSSE